MDVLIVLASDARRGAEIEGSMLAAELRSIGHRVAVVALAPTPLGAARLPVRVLGQTAMGLATLRALRREAAARDVVVAYGSSTLPACGIALRGTRTPFVYRSIGDPAAWSRGRAHVASTALLMRRAAHVTALWDDAAVAISTTYGIPPGRLSVVPNARHACDWIPAAPDERQAQRVRLGVAGPGPVVVTIGALADEKRVDLAVRTVAQLPDARLLVVGDGARRRALEALGTELLGGRVQFTGSVDDVRPAYHAADVVLLTSSTEGMPGVLVEAGMAGVPVVASDVGAVPWLLDRGVRGRALPVTTAPSEWAQAIASVLTETVPAHPTPFTACDWSVVLPLWSTCLHAATNR